MLALVFLAFSAVSLGCAWRAVVLILRAGNGCQYIHLGSKDGLRSLEGSTLSFSVVIMFGVVGGTTTGREWGKGRG